MAGVVTLAILCINCGSSSLKFSVFGLEEGAEIELVRGAIEGISQPKSLLWFKQRCDVTRQAYQQDISSHLGALDSILRSLQELKLPKFTAIGHRVVHGGKDFKGPTLVAGDALNELRNIVEFAPLHLPVQIAMIEASQSRFPSLPHVACFDTSFFHEMPEIAKRYPFPSSLWDAGVRKYGFHGLSYDSIVAAYPEANDGRTVIAHLGNGCSMTALMDGCPIDTSMGFTPAGGLMMGTRCGDLDPGVLVYLIDRLGFGSHEIQNLINNESGLRGVSETSNDMQTLLANRVFDPKAALAIDMFCNRARKQIGAFAATLGGLDALFFTAGIGERASEVRSSICKGLEFMGIVLDQAANDAHGNQISAKESKCRVYIVPSNEEQTIARQTVQGIRTI